MCLLRWWELIQADKACCSWTDPRLSWRCFLAAVWVAEESFHCRRQTFQFISCAIKLALYSIMVLYLLFFPPMNEQWGKLKKSQLLISGGNLIVILKSISSKTKSHYQVTSNILWPNVTSQTPGKKKRPSAPRSCCITAFLIRSIVTNVSQLYCMCAKGCNSPKNISFMLQNRVIVSAKWPISPKMISFLSLCEPYYTILLIVLYKNVSLV